MAASRTVLEVVVTHKDVAASEASIRRILQGRGRRLTKRLNDIPVVGRRNMFRLAQVLTSLVWFLGLLVTWQGIQRGAPVADVLLWGLLTLVFGVISALLLFFGHDRVEVFHFSVLDWLWARVARKSVAKTAAIAPLRITYTIEGDTWRTDVAEPAVSKELRRTDVHEVVCDGPVCLVFRSLNAQRYSAVVWITTPDVREAVERFAG